jgi:NAD(P)-dependent dehydrogenase (short-subunit alcohol dehydrogenase family)
VNVVSKIDGRGPGRKSEQEMSKVSFDISDKVAVITGGAGILCSTMSKHLAEYGAKIAVLDLFYDKAKEVADEIVAKGGDAIAVECDVLSKESIEKACETVMKKYGRVDILINGAGGNKKEATTSEEMKFFDIPKEALSWVLNLNFLGTVMPTQVFGKVMAEQGEGCVINISSTASATFLSSLLIFLTKSKVEQVSISVVFGLFCSVTRIVKSSFFFISSL